jgi:outer membrane protein assembly factor BamB
MESQANSTPATDGQHLLVWFGSEGLYCYDLDGKLLWTQDLGALSSGMYQYPDYEWNTAGSPIIYKNLAIAQVDVLNPNHSFIVAFDIKTGKQVWRTTRDERASWTTPLVYEGLPGPELITAAGDFARGYDPTTGKELWRFGKHSIFPTPTPIAGHNLIYITSGSGTTIQPIYALRPGATGNITLADGESSSESIVWSTTRGGPYLPTPILYQGLLYVCSEGGILAAYNAETGARIYQERLTRGGTYAASGVAADGRLYFTSEDGDVTVVRAGPTYERLASNQMGEVVMATPAISQNMIIFRMQHHVVALAASEPSAPNR